MYCGWQKGTSWDEAMSSSEEINPVALSLAELRLSEGISELVSIKFSCIENFKIP